MLSKRTGRSLRLANLLGLLVLALTARSQTTYTKSFTPPTLVVEYDGSTTPTGGSSTFNRPIGNGNAAPTSLSSVGTNVFYKVKTVTIPADGSYTITVDSVSPANWDNYFFIYTGGGFDPSSPLSSVVAGNEAAFGTGHSGFTGLALTAGTYDFVVTAYNNGDAGSFNVSVSTPPSLGATTFTAAGTTAPVSGSPIFNRPFGSGNTSTPPTSTSGIGTSVYYDLYPFTVATTGNYQIQATAASAWGIAAYLYKTSFSPSAPLTNILAGDNPTTTTSVVTLTQNLTAGTQYYLVTSSYTNGVTGAFTDTVSPITAPVYDAWSGTTIGGPTFHRPSNLSTLASTTKNYAYDVRTWKATVTGTVNFLSACVSTTNWDNFTVLYNGTFAPATPVTPMPVAYNDDFTGATSSGFAFSVVKDVTYTFVTTGYYDTAYTTVAKRGGTYSGTITGATAVAAPILTYSNSLNVGTGATFNRPDANGSSAPAALSTTATAVYYNADTFTVPATGNYSVLSKATNPTNWDNYTVLYTGSFSASAPLNNVLIANDNQTTAGTSGFNGITLTKGVTYVLVTTGTANTNFGAYTVTVAPIVGGGQITSYTDATTAGTGPNFNRPDANGASAPIALNATAKADFYHTYSFTPTLTAVYGIASTSSNPASWDTYFVVYDTDFDPNKPLNNAIIASDSPTFTVPLTKGTTYILVTTGYSNGAYGDFHNKINLGGAVYPPVIPDNDPLGLSLTNTVTDTFTIGSLDNVTILGLSHTWVGDLTATLTHNGVTIELLDRPGRTTTTGYGSSKSVIGDYAFTPAGDDFGAAIAGTASTIPDFTTGGVSYAPYLNGTAGESLTYTGDFTAFNNTSVSGDWTLKLSDLASIITGTYSGFSFVVTPVAASISGTLTFEGLVSTAPAQTVTFTFKPTGSGTSFDKTATVSPNGVYSITGLPLGTFNVHIKSPRNLAVNLPLNLTGGNLAGINAALPAADANGDNVVDTSDFNILAGAFGAVYDPNVSNTITGYDPTADFNGDGTIDTSDFNLLVGEFGVAGDPLL